MDQLNLIQQQIRSLQKQLDNLTHPERIRDIIIFNKDAVTTTSASHTTTIGAGGGSDTFSIPKIPDLYGRVYFRGQAYNIGLYKIA